MLDVDYGIACRTGLHCAPMVHEHLGTDKIHGSVRFGIGPLNTAGADRHGDRRRRRDRDLGAAGAVTAHREGGPVGVAVPLRALGNDFVNFDDVSTSSAIT